MMCVSSSVQRFAVDKMYWVVSLYDILITIFDSNSSFSASQWNFVLHLFIILI